ncbi:GGDEF domain-containing protein [Paenibacillus sp. Marseille-P2973]|uniref:GGDEF domain-containing protein n=1 Tax=unclassified Paenibacillus TaxID=185978 RepID=UPI001B363FD3|nr:GGDEF domain-containing protein [Paenibacillus sp. Marseille-P2973]MBQ4898858.1 GGDEF domain-containing protein [Paenibacillus sp. Marseille-P2973]
MNLTSPYVHYFIYGLLLIVFLGGALYIRALREERNALRELVYRDPVTGLLNRSGFDDFWEHYRKKENLALLSLDLDGFKEINDTYGHSAGDALLKEVSQGLMQVTNKNQLAFRMGGDEFLFIMKNCDPNQVEIMASLILKKISRPYFIQDRDISVTGSIGISMCEASKADRARLLEEADSAMYRAKRKGKNGYHVFSHISTNGIMSSDL